MFGAALAGRYSLVVTQAISPASSATVSTPQPASSPAARRRHDVELMAFPAQCPTGSAVPLPVPVPTAGEGEPKASRTAGRNAAARYR